MFKKMKIVLLASLFGFASSVFADPPVNDGNGNITCDPGCTSLTCSGSFCIICNPEGCIGYDDEAPSIGDE